MNSKGNGPNKGPITVAPASAAAPIGSRYQRLLQAAWFSYSTIVLLQLKVIWGIWYFRELTTGDTSAYFVNGYQWFKYGSAPISWSPLYTSFYGTLLELSSDAFLVTTLHRLLILFTLAVLILALMRKLLPPDLAWLMTAWWVILPINFDALYEVHLFAVIPVVCAALVILGWPGHWRFGGALAVMLVASLLMRNELLLATGILAAMMLGTAAWNFKIQAVRSRLTLGLLGAYAVPLVGASMLTFYYYQHANDLAALSGGLQRKHTLNICQTYAFGYQQRHADFEKSPWTECQALMLRIYGVSEPTLLEAIRRNPSAMLEHFFWNVGLIPSGLQVALFNEASGEVTPDYAPVTTKSGRALWASYFLMTIFAAGLVQLGRNWRYWWDQWLRGRAWGWLLLIATGCVTVGVMISQRPRPSYMFGLAILLRAATGMCLFVLLSRTPWRKWLSAAFPVLVVLIVFFKQSHYAHAKASEPRPLLRAYERLAPFAKTLERAGSVLVSPGYGGELCNYVGKGGCVGLNYYDLRAEAASGNAWPKILSGHSATLVYLDEAVLAEPSGQRLASEAISASWQVLVRFNGGGQNWILLASAGLRP